MDLERGPLFDHALLRLADDRVWWHQLYHHIAIDGVGITLLIHRVGAMYAGVDRHADWALSRLTDAETDYRASAEFAADRSHWLNVFADRPEPTRLLDRPDTSAERIERRQVVLPDDLYGRLRAFAARAGVRPSRLYIAAAAGYVHRVTGATDVVLGLPVTGRSGEAARTVPGMTSNVLPLRVPVSGESTLDTLLASVGAEVRSVVAHSRFRAEELARELGVGAEVGALTGPVVNVVSYGAGIDFGAGIATSGRWVWRGPLTDLAISVLDQPGGGALLDLDADAAVCGPVVLATHERGLLAVLDALVTTPHASLSSVELLSADDRSLLTGFGVSPRETDEITWPAAVERQARRVPDASRWCARTRR